MPALLKLFHILTCQARICRSIALKLGKWDLVFKEQEITPPTPQLINKIILYTLVSVWHMLAGIYMKGQVS